LLDKAKLQYENHYKVPLVWFTGGVEGFKNGCCSAKRLEVNDTKLANIFLRVSPLLSPEVGERKTHLTATRSRVTARRETLVTRPRT